MGKIGPKTKTQTGKPATAKQTSNDTIRHRTGTGQLKPAPTGATKQPPAKATPPATRRNTPKKSLRPQGS